MFSRRILHSVILVFSVFAALTPATMPLTGPGPASAQDGLPDEQVALLERVLASIEVVDSYASYTVALDVAFVQDYTVFQGKNPVDRQRVEFVRQENGTYIAGETSPNVDQHILVSEIVTAASGIPDGYILEGDVRVVDGKSYVNAAFSQDEPDLPAVPDGWFALTEPKDLQIWPGLATLIQPGIYLTNVNAPPSARLFDSSPDALREFLTAQADSITSGQTTGDDGRNIEIVTIALKPDALAMTGMSTDNPVNKLVVESLSGTPLTVSFSLDAGGRLVAYDFVTEVAVTSLDISAAPDIPAGITLSLDLTQTYRVVLTDIDAALPRVDAPALAATGLQIYAPPATPVSSQPWWNDRVFYEVFVRSFFDSDGNGTGDLRGLIDKLDYLNDGDPTTTDDLGVTGLWLMPVAQSPSYHGYDVTDYYTIEQDYGTNQDFHALMTAAHERGMAVIVDLVMNHTSNEHPWFIAASEGDPQFEDFYRWSDYPLDERSPWGSPAWHASGDRYYFGMFWSGMPDLNYENPAVTEAMYDIIAFWLEDMGADGFRLDAIRHLYEDGPVMQNVPETLAWLEDFHTYVHSLDPDALTVGEVWDVTENVAPYVGDKVDIAFEFDFAQAILDAANWQAADPLVLVLDTIKGAYPTGQYATFLTNHDQNRVMSQVQDDPGAAKVAATILLTAPGVPFIYYGEEIGMVGEKPDERIRTPMQWDSTRISGGFTTGQPWEMLATGYRANNVAAMTADPDSLLSHYRALIHLRDDHAALRTGTVQAVMSSNRGVFSILRYGEDETLLIVVNLSSDPVAGYTLTAETGLITPGTSADVLMGDGSVTAPVINGTGGFVDYTPLETLPARSSLIISLK